MRSCMVPMSVAREGCTMDNNNIVTALREGLLDARDRVPHTDDSLSETNGIQEMEDAKKNVIDWIMSSDGSNGTPVESEWTVPSDEMSNLSIREDPGEKEETLSK